MNVDDACNVNETVHPEDNSYQRSRPSKVDLSDKERREFNQFVFRFEDAWQEGSRPDIAKFLPADGPLRLAVLHELVRIDFEYRDDHEGRVEPEEYLIRFSELTADPGQLRILMSWFGQFSTNKRGDSKANRDNELQSAYWSSFKPGGVLGNYTILELISRGGMGAVFKARHQHMNRVVALKTISPLAMKSPEAVKRFHREVRAAARLDHPNIITAHDADKFGDVHVLIMQYVDGCDLASLVRQQGPLSIEETLDYLTQAARGLEYAHRHGVIHRDIKPANLIRDQAGQLKILDMGLARIAETLSGEPDDPHKLTLTGDFVGTADFMAPEQAFDAKNAHCPADIYSLGCTLYYLLTGSMVFRGGSMIGKMLAHRDAPIPRLQDARPDVPDWLEMVFQRMVAKKPADRFQTMSELLAALSAKKEPEKKPIATEQATDLSVGANLHARKWRIVVVSIASLVAVATIAYVVWSSFR